MLKYKPALILILWLCILISLPDAARAAFSDTPTAWTNFDTPTGFTIPYTFNGQPVADEEGSQDNSNGGSGVAPASTDLASGSPDGANPGTYDTPSFGYYNGGTPWDINDPASMEDDFIRFTMRLDGDPRTSKEDFDNYHWNVLMDLDNDGYKEFWIDLDGKYSQKDGSNKYYDRLQILYDNSNNQEIDDPDAAQVAVFSAYNAAAFATSHTRVRAAGDGTGNFYIDMQIPMTAFKDLNGNQILYPDSPVGFVFSTGASANDPLQKDFMTDLSFLTSNDPINFGDIVKPNGEPDLYFADGNLDERDFYILGDNIYLYLRDFLANTDPAAVETVTATVTDPVTGDDETVTLTESGPNSGIFSNLGGADKPLSSDLSNGWIPFVKTSIISTNETWTVAYNSGTGKWTVTGSVSGLQTNTVTAGTEYTSDNGEITFTLYEVNPANGDIVTFGTYAGDPLTASTASGADDDGDLEVASGHTITYSYTNSKSNTYTDTANIVGPGEPFIQFTRAEGSPSDNFELTSNPTTSDRMYVTVYHSDSNSNPSTVQTITVTLSGSDSQTLTLTETGPNTGVFRNTTGLQTKISDGTVTSGDNLWEDIDQGVVTATFTYGGTPYATTTSLFFTEDGGRVYFTNGAGTVGIQQYAAGQPVFVRVEDLDPTACIGSPLTVTVTSTAGDSEVIEVYETAPGSGVYMNRINDLSTALGSAVVTSASSTFVTDGVSAGFTFVIATGPDTGTYTVSSVNSQTQITLTETLTATRTDISFSAMPLLTATYNAATAYISGLLESADQDTLTVSYDDCRDGDPVTTNDIKTDTAMYNAPSIVINEVLFFEDTTTSLSQHEFVQLYNAATEPIDVTGYVITDEDGNSYTIPQYDGSNIELDPGQKLYIVYIPESLRSFEPIYDSGTDAYYVFNTGSGGTGTGTDNLSDPGDADTADQISLYNSLGELVDYVAWSTTTTNTTDFKGDDAAAVNAVAWTDNDFRDVATITLGQSIQRETDGVDNDIPSDWVYATPSLDENIIVTFAAVSAFRAYTDGGDVVVEWETAAEFGTIGFYLYRRDDETGKHVLLNEDILPGLLHSQQGGTYRYVDETAYSGESYEYRLVEIDVKDKKRKYGPFRVTVNGPGFDFSRSGSSVGPMRSQFSREPHGISDNKKARRAARRSEKKAYHAFRKQRTGDAAKIAVVESGFYYLDASEIADVLGVSAKQAENLIRRNFLDLTNQGRSVAYLPAGKSKGIYFYGEAIDSPYTRENIYRLEKGRGLEIETVKGPTPEPSAGYDTFIDTIHLEEDHWALTGLHDDPEADYWRWDYIFSGYPGLDTKTFTFRLNGVAGTGGTAALTLHLQASSDTPADFDHHVIVSMNGTEILDEYWDGTDLQVFETYFDQALLYEGENTIEVDGMLEADVPYSIFYVDSFDITYHRYYSAANDRLLVRGDGNPVITIDGFSGADIYVFDITNPKKPKRLAGTFIDGYGGGYQVGFYTDDPATEYFAATMDAIGAPVSISADAFSRLKSHRNRADYLVITPSELEETIQSLADFRRRQGLETMVVRLEDVMDEFNEGLFSPEAIRDFLSYAYYNWRKAPRYVLLVGEGTYDYRDVQGYGDNLMPVMMVSTPDGLFASDNRFADVEGDDGLPEMAVGRLPVLTAEELQTVIDKIITYEIYGTGGWREKVLMLADNPDEAGNFAKDSDAVAGIFPGEYTVEKIYLSDHTLSAARRRILDAINEGAMFLDYFGHGAVGRFAQEGMLTTGDVASLENGVRLPVITAMTCVAGQFAIPGYDALGEALLLHAGGGAIAVWSPTGLSNNTDARILNEVFYRAVFADETTTLGDVVLSALEEYSRRGSGLYMLDIYNLLGDPALNLW